MLFNSLEFLIFFPVVCLLYFPLPQALKKPWLLVCSYYFYMCWHAGFALLIFVSTLSTWVCGFFIERCTTVKLRRLALALNLALNLGILFTFKYFDFFSGSIAAIFGAKPLLLSLTLPVGISFYTFQALGYSIDVYRGDIPHEKNFLNYALFVSFFPQLVAGPIERSVNFIPQLHERKYFDERRVESGIARMLVGFFKKVVIADGLAAFVDVVYAAPEKFSAAQLIFATVAFAIQIYCDFGGYSDIAVGAAQVLGFRLMQNFDRPYFASSVDDFWRRWHISLSGWLRDYVYIPLGGNRKGAWRKRLNLFITFLASGLWHGASWTYVAWGALHGIYQVIGDITRGVRKKLYADWKLENFWLFKALRKVLGCVFTFALTNLAYVFFRAQTLPQAVMVLQRIFAAEGGSLLDGKVWLQALQGIQFFGLLPVDALSWAHILTNTGIGLGLCVALLILLDLGEGRSGRLIDRISRCPYPVRWAFCLVLLGAIMLYGSFEPSGFYYFQF
ncbi:MAG: MBOAT family protein [Oscillospiraceae bacterium]|nr:MBOAT family protein [Oscillospiraceae bacterium]